MSQKIGMGTIATRKTRPHPIFSRLPACFLREARGVNITACPISCLCRTPLYGCLPGEYYEKPDHSQDNPKPLPTSANEVTKPACMVRSQALLLKALANAPLLARLPPQQSNRHRTWGFTHGTGHCWSEGCFPAAPVVFYVKQTMSVHSSMSSLADSFRAKRRSAQTYSRNGFSPNS
jgi:hypothetical protein